MFAAGVPEKLVKSVTGHKSTKALELCERPTVQQQQAVSKVLSSGVSYSDGLESVRSQLEQFRPVDRPEHEPPRTVVRLHSVHTAVTSQQSCTHVPGFLGSMFAGLINCSRNTSPQNFVINIQQPPQQDNFDFGCAQFDELVCFVSCIHCHKLWVA